MISGETGRILVTVTDNEVPRRERHKLSPERPGPPKGEERHDDVVEREGIILNRGVATPLEVEPSAVSIRRLLSERQATESHGSDLIAPMIFPVLGSELARARVQIFIRVFARGGPRAGIVIRQLSRHSTIIRRSRLNLSTITPESFYDRAREIFARTSSLRSESQHSEPNFPNVPAGSLVDTRPTCT